MKNKLLLIVFIIQMFPLLVFAGNTGKLAGKVTDSKTGEALFGINVVVESTKQGAATGAEGDYIVNNIEPGVYSISASGIGYQKKKYTNVKISSDFTTRLEIQLSEETVNLESVVVIAEAPLIRKDLTSSQAVLDDAAIRSLPVESVEQVLSLQAGIVKGVNGELHIRGGRSTEIEYTVNGVSVGNPFNNSKTVQISTNAIQELSVVSGTFNAEYGNALSGVVNTITKEGGAEYRGSISFYTGDYVSSNTNPFYNIDAIDVVNNYVIEGTVGGPIPYTDGKVTFFASGRINRDNGYLYGIRQHTIYDSVWKDINNPENIKISSTGDGKIVPLNTSYDMNYTGKMTFKPITTVKINYDFVYSRSKSRSYDHDLKYNPDAVPTDWELGLLNTIEIRQALGNSTFYSLKGSYNFYDYKRFLFPMLDKSGEPVDYYPGLGVDKYFIDQRYQPTYKINTTVGTYTFLSGGTRNNHYYQRSKVAETRLDFTSQVDGHHEVKTGVHMKFNSLDYETFDIIRDSTDYPSPTILGVETSRHDLYSRMPVQFAVYIQDKMEFESIILNAGLRYDYFIAKAKYAPDRLNPTANLINPDAKTSLSPRMGMSFPITDKGIIHFSYGHFYQIPPFSYLYTNPNFEQISGSPTFGNSNLKPEKTVSYELGLQQQLTDDIAFNVTGFYKDVRDLLALQQIRVSGSSTYNLYVNKDYGNIKGITFSFTKRRTADSYLGVTFDYTYQVAEGNETNSDAFFLDLASGRQSEKVPVPLNWDQRHTLNSSVSFGNSQDWTVTLVGRIGTGLPYTPEITTRQIYLRSNSERRPSQFTVDLLAEKSFVIFDNVFTVFVKVFNLFDRKNERSVFLDTGRSTYTLEESKSTAQAMDEKAAKIAGAHSAKEYFVRPQYYAPPREVRFGVSVEL